jgi:hypothetical protein
VEPDVEVVLIHGTWGRWSRWHRPGSRVREALGNALRERGLERVRFRRFLWSGGNSVGDRARAASALREALSGPAGEGERPFRVAVAHSHGGNAAVRAMVCEENEPGRAPLFDGIACLGTPFLVGTRRSQISRGLLAGALGPLLAGHVMWRNPPALLGEVSQWGESNGGVYFAVGGIVTAILFASIAIGLRVSKELIPGSGVSESVARRMLILRSCGDEAGATLSISYVLLLAIGKLGLLVAWPIHAASEWVATSIAGWEKGGKVLKGFFACLGYTALALAAGGFGFGWVESKIPDLMAPGLILLLLGVLCAIRALQLALGLLISLGQAALGVCVQLVSEVAFGALLLPFGPELLVATPYVMVSSEVIPPVENGGQVGAIHQLGVSAAPGVGLRHAVYDEPRSVEILAGWIDSLRRSHSPTLRVNFAPAEPQASRVA